MTTIDLRRTTAGMTHAMKPSVLVVASSLALSGCASMSPETCRAMDWFELGLRDGARGGAPLVDQHAGQCVPHGSAPDAVAYARGFEAGRRNWSLYRY